MTRAEIEEIRGVATSKGTLDLLLETGWIRMRGRRRAPGRPVTYGTTEAFLAHFGLDRSATCPGVDELKGAGLLDSRVPAGFSIPEPHAGDELTADEDPLEEDDFRAELRRRRARVGRNRLSPASAFAFKADLRPTWHGRLLIAAGRVRLR